MTFNAHTILLLIAALLFLLDALGAPTPKVNKTALGLFFLTLAFLV